MEGSRVLVGRAASVVSRRADVEQRGRTLMEPETRGKSPSAGAAGRQARRRALKEVLASSSFNGVSHLASATSGAAAAFWALVTLACLAGFSFNLAGLVLRFMEGPVLENYAPEIEPFLWPDITLCNPLNPLPFWKFPGFVYRRWRAEWNRSVEYGRAIFARGFGTRMTVELAMSSLDPRKGRFADVHYTIFNAALNSDSRFESEQSMTNYKGSGTFQRRHRGRFYTRLVPHRFPTPCVTFNPAGLNDSGGQGSREVRSVSLVVIMDYHSLRKFNSYLDNRKLIVYVSPAGHTVSPGDRHFALPGTDVYLQLEMTRSRRLPHRGTCSARPFTVEVYDALLSSTQTFRGSHDDCAQVARQNLTLSRCGCLDPSLLLARLGPGPPRLCLNMSEFAPRALAENVACMARVAGGDELPRRVAEDCAAVRLPPCDRVLYAATHNALPWSQDTSPERERYMGILNFALPNMARDSMRRNILFLNVRRRSERASRLTEEYSYGAPQFVSDIGGILGLWMGLSIIGLFELGSVLAALWRCCCAP